MYDSWSYNRTLPNHLHRVPGPHAITPIGQETATRMIKAIHKRPAVRTESVEPREQEATERGIREQEFWEHKEWQRRPRQQRARQHETTDRESLERKSPEQEIVTTGAPEELGRIQSRLALWDSKDRESPAQARTTIAAPRYEPSDQIHVMGLDMAGRYIAHTLAGAHTIPPVRYMLHSLSLHKRWHEANRQLTLYRGDQRITRHRIIGEYTPPDGNGLRKRDVIHNLIVTLPAFQVVRALQHIKHRLDHRSTICLVNDGLGVAEALIEEYFPDESTRPVFLLAHFTTSLDHTDSVFSVSEVRPGRLFLSIFSPPGREDQRFRVKRHPPVERTARAAHFIRLLSAMPGLNATGHPLPDFLRYKLPTIAFRTIVDPLAALLDCRYDFLPGNAYARQLMDRLIGELAHVMSLLPECRDSQSFRQVAIFGTLRDEVLHKLLLQRTADSKMRQQLGEGWDTDVEFLSGYFVKRARDLGTTAPAMDSIMWAVKAKQVVMVKKLTENEIPFEGM